jgi:hypothetical protein
MSEQVDQSISKDFCELLFTPALALYFKSVYKTNTNGFSSGSTPVPGVWEVFVYDDSFNSNRAVKGTRVIRSFFSNAVKYLGKHLKTLESNINEVLEHIRTKDLTAEESGLFGLFFDIVYSDKGANQKAQVVTIADYKTTDKSCRLNVKTIEHSLDTAGAYTKNVKNQQGGSLTQRLALVASYLPIVLKTDSIPDIVQQQFIYEHNVGGTEVGGGKSLTGGANDEEQREAILRIAMEREFEAGDESVAQEVDQVVTHEEIAQYLACVGEKATAPISNVQTLALLPTNAWRKLSDGSYEKLTSEGYKPLSREECEKLLTNTCAGSNISNTTTCEAFMAAVNSQDAEALVQMLTANDQFIWESNTATDSMDKLHPETVLRILKALGFGTKNGPYGKRVCTVEEWLNECVKNGSLKSVTSANLKQQMRSYLEHLVAFVNSNPSIVDPSKRSMAALTSATTPDELKQRGLYYAGEELRSSGSSQLSFHDVSRAVNMHQSGIDLRSVLTYPTTAFGAVGGQRGGNHLYTQAAQAQLSLGSGISQLVEQSINGLQATSNRLSEIDVTQIREKVKKLTTLEQEIYQHIVQFNELRLAADSGVNCHSQLSSVQDRLMQLGSVYDRRAPCLQELCEQLRMLLAQQQNKSGCEPIA